MNGLVLVMLMGVGQIVVDYEIRQEVPNQQTSMEVNVCPDCGRTVVKKNGVTVSDSGPKIVRYTIPNLRQQVPVVQYWAAPIVAYVAPSRVVQYSQRHGLFGLQRRTWTAIQPGQAYTVPIQTRAPGNVYGACGGYGNRGAYGGGTPYRQVVCGGGRCGGGNCRR